MRERIFWVVGLVAILAFILVACAPATPAPETPAPATPTPVEEKTMVILAEDIPAGMDWEGPSVVLPTSQTGFSNIYEPLINYSFVESETDPGVFVPDFTNAEPALAESWEVAEDGVTWTFHLREGLKSAWGNELTVDDIEWSLSRGKNVGGSVPCTWFLMSVMSFWDASPLAPDATPEDKALGPEFKKIDDYTFQIKQFEPNKLVLPVMPIYCMYIHDSDEAKKHLTEDDPWGYKYLNEEGAYGFGAYTIESWTKDVEFIARANPNYWAGKPPVDKIIYRKVPTSSSRYAAVLKGDAQVVEHLTYKEFDDLMGQPGVTVNGVYGNENLFLQLNWNDPLWQNIDMRKALAYAIPYEDIIETAYYGQAKQWNGLIHSTYISYHEKPFYSHDLDKAREYLAKAGFPEGQGLEAYPESLKLTYVVERSSFLEPVATLMQTELAKVGIPIVLDPIPNVQYGDRMIVKKDLPMGFNDMEKAIGPDAGYQTMLYFVTAPAGINNMANYSNARVDELFYAARGEADFEKRDAMLDEIQTILMEDLAWVPIVERKTLIATSDNVCCNYWYPDNSLRWKHFDYVE